MRSLTLLLIIVLSVGHLSAVSVLSHEEMVDVMWDSEIRSILLSHFPDATADQIKGARAFAYGGSVIQDVGYYPLGNQLFTNYLHYVRTGDFIASMIREARGLNELAFALGALSHYSADAQGHQAVNFAVPVLYPKLRKKYGNSVTYEDDRDAHLRTEFSFDVLEVAKHRYNTQQYHDFIGFDVSEDLMERAFQDTYGMPMDQLLHYDDLTLETFRFSVSKVIPEITQVALATNKPKVSNEHDDAAKKIFLYHLSRTDYEREFGTRYRHPGCFARILGFLIKLLPFGPAKVLGYRNPTPQAEDLYFRSMDKAITEYRRFLEQAKAGQLEFPNRNFDTGQLSRPGEYVLCDRTYAALVDRLAKDHFRHLTPGVKADILAFFFQGSLAMADIKPRDRRKLEKALAELKNAPANTHGTASASSPQ